MKVGQMVSFTVLDNVTPIAVEETKKYHSSRISVRSGEVVDFHQGTDEKYGQLAIKIRNFGWVPGSSVRTDATLITQS